MGSFIQKEILGMQWIHRWIGQLLKHMGVDMHTRMGGSIQFFLYDVIKITILLCVLIFLISYIQSYFPPERSKKIMGRFHGIGANIMGALLGTVTPFCSCSTIRQPSNQLQATCIRFAARKLMFRAVETMLFKSVIKSAFRFALLFDGTGFFLDIETPLKKRKTFDNHQMPFGAYTIRNRS